MDKEKMGDKQALKTSTLGGRRSVGFKLGLIFSAAVALIIIFSGVMRANMERLEEMNQLRENTRRIIASLTQVLSAVKDAETGQRGYILTGKEEYLKPYHDSGPIISKHMEVLERLFEGMPEQQERLQYIEDLIRGPDGKLFELAKTIELERNDRHDEAIALVNSDKGKEIMATIRNEIDAIVEEQDHFLEARNGYVIGMLEQSKKAMIYGTIFGVLAIIISLTVVILNITRPLNQLSEHASRISEWDFDYVSMNPLRDDEIGVLDRSFQEMVQALKARSEELEQARLAAEQANESKSFFLASVSHEIRTPMSGVIGLSELLMNSDLDESDEESVFLIKNSAESLLNMIDQILIFSKTGHGSLVYNESPFDLVATIDEVIRILKHVPQVQERRLELVASYNCDSCEVLGDEQKIKQVLINLINNAIKYTKEGGVHVELDAKRLGEESYSIRVDVHDTGVGIAPDRINSIFEYYQQNAANAMPTYGGVGLGLSISRDLINGMGGSISVESELGVGSTFTVSLELPVRETERNLDA